MKLKEYLEREGIPGYRFARTHGLVSSVVYKHIGGGRVEYETAKKFSEATGGAVTVSDIMD